MKPQFPHLLTLFCLLLLLAVVSCKKKEPDPMPKSAEKAISGFVFSGLTPAVTATVDGTAKTVMATVPFGTDVTKLVPTINLSAKATVAPASGVAQDFSKTVTYTVTAEDGTTQAYAVAVGVGAAPKSMAKEITAFSFSGLSPVVNSTIDGTTKTISATLPAGTDATKLIPTITISAKATVSPATGVAQDFTKAVTYTVTAEDGTTQAYSVTVTAPVLSNNGTVYIGNLDGNFYALDALTGAKKWEVKFSDAIQATPTVVNGLVYVASWDKKLYALDAATGAKKWESAQVLNQPFAAPMVANGVVYYGGDHYLYAFDALTGAEKWKYQDDDVYSWQASPTVVDGIVYASIRGSAGGKSGLHALNATTGILKWHQPAIGISESSPAVANGLLFAGSEGQGFMAFDVQTGAVRWQLTEASVVNSSPTIVNGIVYFGSGVFGKDNQKLYSLDALTGAKKWDYATETSTAGYSSPIVSGGIVYIGVGSTLYAIDAATGARKWTALPEANNLIYSGPVVATGLVYLGIGKKMYAFDAATGTKKWEYDTGRTIDASSPCVVSKDGTIYYAGISGMVQ